MERSCGGSPGVRARATSSRCMTASSRMARGVWTPPSAACAKRPKSLEMPLVFRPEMIAPGQHDPVPASPGLRLSIAPIADERTQKDRIGENTEMPGDPRPVFAAARTPAEFLQDIVAQELSSVGYRP